MGKSIKRIYTLLCMVAMFVMMIPSMAFAAEADETKVAINVKVPDDWQNPCVWAWDEDGNNAFEAWPGEECEATPDNEGWYYVWVPDWANHVIVNANAGEVQTGELVLDGKDAWITVSDADNAEVSYDAQTTGDTPEYTEKFLIHAKVDDSWENPNLWAWSAPDGTNAFEAWPGKAMTAGEDGWYTAKAPTWVNSIIINANNGDVQTEDLSIDPAEIWVTVAEDGTADFSYTDPEKAEIPNVTVHVKAPSDWENPNLWAWSAPDGTNAFASWPGEALEENNGWLTKEIPGWVNSIIVNGNDGSVQTSDISIETEKDVWVVVTDAENYEVTYEEPDATAIDATATDAAAEETTTETAETENIQQSSTPIVLIIIIVIVLAVIVAAVVTKKKSK
ncbi:MAG: starch-binding protein [Lachnospiraceae bacterium]|nr:starch-binding protein [Lachnospiraceae bacterium]